jgi:c(7)-type cytochrome triheme protein
MNMKRLTIVLLAGWLSMPAAAGAQVGGGDLTFTPRDTLPVVFSHEKHVREKAIRCADCHYKFFQMAHGSFKMNMDKMNKAMFCGSCHDGQKAFDVKDSRNCSRCHR